MKLNSQSAVVSINEDYREFDSLILSGLYLTEAQRKSLLSKVISHTMNSLPVGRVFIDPRNDTDFINCLAQNEEKVANLAIR